MRTLWILAVLVQPLVLPGLRVPDCPTKSCTTLVEWQARLFAPVRHLEMPEPLHTTYQERTEKLLQLASSISEKEEKDAEEEGVSVEDVAGALKSADDLFQTDLPKLFKGLRDGDDEKVALAVMGMVSDIFSTIGAFNPEVAIIGTALAIFTSIVELVMSILSGTGMQHGSIPIAEVMNRVVEYQLDQYMVKELAQYFDGIKRNILDLHESLDRDIPRDETQAQQNLETMQFDILCMHDLPAFVGRVQSNLQREQMDKGKTENILNLLNMYWLANLHQVLLLQRAVRYLATAVTDANATGWPTSTSLVYSARVGSVRENMVPVLTAWQSQLSTLSRRVLVAGDPSVVPTPIMFEMAFNSRSDQPLYLSESLQDGNPDAVTRPGQDNWFTVHFQDDSQWRNQRFVPLNTKVALRFMNSSSWALDHDDQLFYMGSGSVHPRYMHWSACEGEGSTKAMCNSGLFTLESSNALSSENFAIEEGDWVIIRSVWQWDQVLCGEPEGSLGMPQQCDDGMGEAYCTYRKNAWTECREPSWRVRVGSNAVIQSARHIVDGLLANLAKAAGGTILLV